MSISILGNVGNAGFALPMVQAYPDDVNEAQLLQWDPVARALSYLPQDSALALAVASTVFNQLALSTGASKIGYDGGTVQDVADEAKPLANYAALRAYTGRASGVRITDLLTGGIFERDPADTTTPDNGGTVIVDGAGRRWKRYCDPARLDVRWFMAVLNGIADDSTPVQNAINALPATGGEILVNGNALVGGLVINIESVTIRGIGPGAKLTVKNSTTGVRVQQNFVNFKNILVISQGTKGDGLGTIGIHYEKTTVNSIGFAQLENLNIRNFSGDGIKVINAINFAWRGGFVVSCGNGAHFDRDAGAVLFGTTIHLDDVYFSSCTNGILGNYCWRSRFNVIAETCTYGMRMNGGAYTLFRCYFEANTTLGVLALNSEVQDLWSYSNNATTDAVSITFDGAVAAASRGSVVARSYDHLAKRLGLLSGYGVDPTYLSAHGTANNQGLKYGENTVALVRGVNMFDNAAWAPNRLAELIGWDHINQGYKVSGTTAGDNTYGMLQTVTLDSTKTYVIDFQQTIVSGSGMNTIRVGAQTVTSGVPFVPAVNGANIIKAFGVDTAGTAFEVYVNVFTIAEVKSDINQVAQSNDQLTRKKNGRGVSYAAAAPTTGRWMQGEVIYNTAPAASGFVGWVCVASGSPGTWKTFGAISA